MDGFKGTAGYLWLKYDAVRLGICGPGNPDDIQPSRPLTGWTFFILDLYSLSAFDMLSEL